MGRLRDSSSGTLGPLVQLCAAGQRAQMRGPRVLLSHILSLALLWCGAPQFYPMCQCTPQPVCPWLPSSWLRMVRTWQPGSIRENFQASQIVALLLCPTGPRNSHCQPRVKGRENWLLFLPEGISGGHICIAKGKAHPFTDLSCWLWLDKSFWKVNFIKLFLWLKIYGGCSLHTDEVLTPLSDI